MKNALYLRLQNQPDALNSLLAGLTEADMLAKPMPGKWSIHQNLAHLGRYHEIFKDRAALIVGGANPVFQAYKADEDDAFLEWERKQFGQLLEDFYAGRASLNNYLSSLTEEQLRCTGRHPVFGLMDVEGWAEFFLLHEAHHYFTVFKLAAKLRAENALQP